MTHHNQTKELTTWFLNLPLDESIDNKSTKFDVQIQNPIKHSCKTPKAKKSSRRSSRRRTTAKASKWHENDKAKQNGKEELRKAQKSKKSSKSTLLLKSTPPNPLNAISHP
jgi:chromatin remodeling complex protein RSC6